MAAAKIGIGDDEAVIAALALYDRVGNLLYLSPDRVVSKRHVIGGPGSEFSYYTTEKSVDFRLELPVLQPEMQLTVRLLFAIKELGLTEAQYGYIMGVSALISVGFVLATGYVLDRVSPLLFLCGIFCSPFSQPAFCSGSTGCGASWAGQPEITSRRYRNGHSLSCFTKPSSASVPEALPGFRKDRKRRRRSRVAPHVNQTVVTAPTSKARGRE